MVCRAPQIPGRHVRSYFVLLLMCAVLFNSDFPRFTRITSTLNRTEPKRVNSSNSLPQRYVMHYLIRTGVEFEHSLNSTSGSLNVRGKPTFRLCRLTASCWHRDFTYLSQRKHKCQINMGENCIRFRLAPRLSLCTVTVTRFQGTVEKRNQQPGAAGESIWVYHILKITFRDEHPIVSSAFVSRLHSGLLFFMSHFHARALVDPSGYSFVSTITLFLVRNSPGSSFCLMVMQPISNSFSWENVITSLERWSNNTVFIIQSKLMSVQAWISFKKCI